MADVFSKEKRSQVMSRIGGKNTRPEKVVRSFLHRQGFRFRLHQKDLPGKPDIVLPKYRTIVLIHGCFWHHHPRCRRATLPSSQQAFWLRKIEANRDRDRRQIRTLRRLGWRVLTIWECQTRRPETLKLRLMPLLEMRG
jgi:DNA mismatch endonuclease (patch repair protein)